MNRTFTLAATTIVGLAAVTTAVFTTAGFSLTSAPTTENEMAGYMPLTFDAPHHGRDALGAIWYPAASGGRMFTMGENGVFFGVDVVEEAPIRAGEHPIVLLSHGMGGNIRSTTWLAAALADRGAIVISVNHPNSTWGDFDIAKGMDHWTRAQDLSVALDAALATPLLADHIDMDRVMAAGFSYGGWTALSLGGLLGNHAAYVDHCETYTQASSHCVDLLRWDARIGDVDPDRWNASYGDPRITHVTAVDPALIWGMDAGNIADLVPNLRLIALGDGDDRLFATNFDISGFVDLVPNADIDRIAPASHFMFLPLCKPMGEAILIEENDDPVCTDPEGSDRSQLHDDVITLIASDLGL